MTDKPLLPAYYFSRQDDSPDEDFYSVPRMEKHIDDATISAITQYYGTVLVPSSRVLDLMSSWISHLPADMQFHQVTGLGMNLPELAANPRLDTQIVHNLNETPVTPFADNSFDAVLIVVSVQYLTQPFQVFADIGRILAPGGQCIVSMSHRLFPTKAIYAFQALSPQDRCRLVSHYLEATGCFQTIEVVDRSPPAADPLWIVHAKRAV